MKKIGYTSAAYYILLSISMIVSFIRLSNELKNFGMGDRIDPILK
jgi:hypothetical protein